MIILIGGSGSIGKTKLAYDLMIDNHIPYFSLDSLMMGIYRSDRNCGYTPESKAELVIEKLWPITLEMIKTNIENCHSFIFEGFQLNPRNYCDIEDDYRAKIIPVFLIFSENYLKENYKCIVENRNAFENRSDHEELESLLSFNTNLLKECKSNRVVPYIIKNNYVEEMELIRKDINLTIAST